MVTKLVEIDGCKTVVDAKGKAQRRVTEYYGLSSDNKPKDAKNADVFYEMDTTKVFLYDQSGKAWVEQGL